jgi:hypothetical protein
MVFHVGASLLLAASCGFYIAFAWQLACGNREQWVMDGGQFHMQE